MADGDLVVLLAEVEVSDKYGQHDTYVLGVFDYLVNVEETQKWFNQFYTQERVVFRQVKLRVNELKPPPKL